MQKINVYGSCKDLTVNTWMQVWELPLMSVDRLLISLKFSFFIDNIAIEKKNVSSWKGFEAQIGNICEAFNQECNIALYKMIDYYYSH